MTAIRTTTRRTSAVSVDTHLRQVLSLARPTSTVQMTIRLAAGVVLADDITAPCDLPPFDNSAMDGYAVRAEDIDASGALLEVIADIAAGCGAPATITPGTAARIMTGAPVPRCATAVVPVEYTKSVGDSVFVCRPIRAGEHIRRAGEELTTGDVVVRCGEILTPARIAALASLGLDQVTVHRRPRVAVLSTGSELVRAGRPRPAGAVYDASATMLEALLNEDGATVTVLDHVPDDEDQLLTRVRSAAAEHDMLITTGGISAGAYEVVKQGLAPFDSMSFGRVAMSPGSPQGVGVVDGALVLALPGNPSATLVSYLVFGRPLVGRLLGQRAADPRWLPAPLGAACAAHPEVTRFVPAVRDGLHVVPLEAGAAHRLSRLGAAECLLRLDAGRTDLTVGALVPTIEL